MPKFPPPLSLNSTAGNSLNFWRKLYKIFAENLFEKPREALAFLHRFSAKTQIVFRRKLLHKSIPKCWQPPVCDTPRVFSENLEFSPKTSSGEGCIFLDFATAISPPS
ncbi:hypothetical protein LINPERHAP1_LOCUS18680 [Linum perenne]